MYKKVFILVFALYFAITFASCSNTKIKDDRSTNIDKYNPAMGEYSVSYLIDANSKSSPNNFKEKNLLYIPKNEPIEITFGSANLQDKGHKIIMKVYYDYKMIDFKLGDKDKFISEHIFNLKNNTKISININLEDEIITYDNKMHKLLITFTTGYTQHASDLDLVTDSYGLSAVYDVVHQLDYESNFNSYPYAGLIPKSNFDKSFGNLIINTDYENTTQKSEFGGILNPPPMLKTKKGSVLPLMYNLNKANSESALIILTLNYDQIKINDKFAELIKLDGNKGTANGTINIKVPIIPGKYELIGYVIHNPYKKYSGGSNLVYTSYRFTLLVE